MSNAIVARGTGNVSLPGGAGGSGAVASVNGHTGVVVLTASDVGADTAGAAAAAQAASQPLDADLTALAALSATAGLLARTGANAFTQRTLAAGSANVTVTNGDGSAGNPTVDLPYSAFVDVSTLGTNVSQGTPHVQVRTEPGTVTRMQGQILLAASQTFTAGSTVMTIQAGFRAAATSRFSIRTVGSSTLSVWTIDTDGTVKNVSAITAGGAGDTVNFDGVTFIHA